MRAFRLAALPWVLLVVLGRPGADAARDIEAPPRPHTDADEPPAGLTREDWKQIRRAVRQSEYHASRATRSVEAPALTALNRKQAYQTTFRRDGIEIGPRASAPAAWRLGVSVTGYGFEGDVRPLAFAEPRHERERVTYHRGPVTEWYVNRPSGLEQGFELAEPQPRRAGPLIVALAVEGDLALRAHGDGVSFADRDGGPVLRYAGLKAWDADGKPLPSRMEAVHRQIRLVVEAQTARFPVTVDPVFVHEAQLFGHGDPAGQAGAESGYSVSVSGDTVVVGAPFTSSPAFSAGAVDVFVRSGTTWTEQQRLTASDAVANDHFGWSVSVSGDTLVVGAKGGYPTTTIPGWAYVFVRTGTTWTEQQKLLAADGAANDYFGGAVSVSGDTVVVGAYLDDTPGGMDAGSAYVFVRSGTTWSQQQKLLASDGAAGDNFGYSVSAFADTVAAGAPGHDLPGGGDAGSAYVFARSGATWTEQQRLTASDAAVNDSFGWSVSVSGDTLVAGAPGVFPATVPGWAYVFVRSGTTWTEQQKLLASDGLTNDLFGSSVSVFQDTVVVGSRFDDTAAGSNAGSAYVFVRAGTTWIEQQKLTASTGAAIDFFGSSVSISGDTVAAGAPNGDAPGGGDAGATYMFVRAGTTWTEQQKLLASGGTANDQFGWSVSVSGDTVAVGAPQDSVAAGQYAGSAYVFVRAGTIWSQQQKLLASDGAPGDHFASSVSVHGDTLVVGAEYDDTAAGVNAGAAYVFVRSGTTWTQQQKLTASDAMAFDVFGRSVSIHGDTIVAGAPESAAFAVGAAYVFLRSGATWTQEQKLVASDGGTFQLFGTSVSISGDTVLVGKPTDSGFGGAAYVFLRSAGTWSQQQKLTASGPVQARFFGRAVALSGDTAIVGAPLDGADAGAAYMFVRFAGFWTEQQKLVASDVAAEDRFGSSVAVFGDTVVVGSPNDDIVGAPDAGSAYVFVRTGTTWTEQQKLVAPDAEFSDAFGYSTAVAGDTIAVAALQDDTPEGQYAGSVHVYRPHLADLAVTKTDAQTTAVPGEPVTYTIVASNNGPDTAVGASLTDPLPAALLGATWTCTATPASSCTGTGIGNINDLVSLAVGGTATYTVTGTVAAGASGTLTNTATVAPPSGTTDTDPSNNSATDVDTLAPESDLAITKTDSADPVSPGDPLTYALAITNAGPSDATSVTVTDTLPAGVTFVSSSPGPPVCTLAGATLTCSVGPVPSGNSSTVTIDVTVNPGAMGIIVNTAAVAGSDPDPDPTNNSASATTLVGQGDGELSHGARVMLDLAAQPGPTADEDLFRISQKPRSSYEVVLDATSGDIGIGAGPYLERVAADGITILQASVPIGTGFSRSLRWRNAASSTVDDQVIRVRSAGCGTDCAADDVYRLRAYETTYSVPRFNNAGTQITVLVLQNPNDYAIAGEAYFQVSSGAQVAVQPFALGPRETLVLNTATVPGANGVSGAITVAHDGRYGDLAGKAVALEPATGFSFDSPLLPRMR